MSIDNPDVRMAREIVRGMIAPQEAKVVLFGSRARGDARPYSDIDLALFPRSAFEPGRLAALREALEDSSLLVEVDLVDMRTAAPELAATVAREGGRGSRSAAA